MTDPRRDVAELKDTDVRLANWLDALAGWIERGSTISFDKTAASIREVAPDAIRALLHPVRHRCYMNDRDARDLRHMIENEAAGGIGVEIWRESGDDHTTPVYLEASDGEV